MQRIFSFYFLYSIKIKYLFLFLFLLNSCKHDVDVDLPPFEEKLVVESYIVQGDSAFIVRIDKTVNPIIKSNTITYDTNFAGTEVILSYNNNNFKLRQMSVYLDEGKYNVFSGNHGRFFVLDKKVENINTLKLIANYRTYHVESECVMLPAVHIKNAVLTGTSNYSESQSREIYSIFTVNVEADFPSGISYYMMRIMRPPLDTIREHSLLREITKGYFVVYNSVQKNKFIFNNTFSEQVGWFNNYTIILSRIEKLHYYFALSSVIQFGESNTMIPTETTEVPSNIRGGYGIFTAMSNDTIKVKIQ